jgi:hypothetical protein
MKNANYEVPDKISSRSCYFLALRSKQSPQHISQHPLSVGFQVLMAMSMKLATFWDVVVW